MRVWGMSVVCAAVVALMIGATAGAQSNTAAAAQDQQAQIVESGAIAQSIVDREQAASARTFDPGFRAEALRRLASMPSAQLDAIQGQNGGLGTSAYGDSQADLVYTPVTPCRIIDTRLAGGAIAAGGTRSFLVAATNYSSQGGSATTCGVPFGPATAAVINFVAVNATAPGDVRVTPYGTTMPLASILNYAGVAGLNLANGPVVTLCNPAVKTSPLTSRFRPTPAPSTSWRTSRGFSGCCQRLVVPSPR